MHEIIATALATFGITAHLQQGNCDTRDPGPLCFRHVTCGDLMIGEHKVVGSAMRKARGAILQHGGILLERSPRTPGLPGIEELSGQKLMADALGAEIAEAFARSLATHVEDHTPSREEAQWIQMLVIHKYADSGWNYKR
jgi:lipoate-protein ligase A